MLKSTLIVTGILLAVIAAIRLARGIQVRSLELLPIIPRVRRRWAHLVSTIGPEKTLAILGSRWTARMRRRMAKIDHHERRGLRVQVQADGIRSAMLGRGSRVRPSWVLLMFLLALVWVFVFLLQRYLDIGLFIAMGYPTSTATAYGTIFPIIYSVLGIGIWSCLGVHSAAPQLDASSPRVRRRIAAGLLAILFAISVVLLPVGAYRSQQSIGKEVANGTLIVEQLKTRPLTPQVRVQLAAEQAQVDQSKSKLERASTLDKTLVVVMPAVEALVSPGPLFLAELLVLGLLALVLRRHDRRARLTRRRAETMAAEVRRLAIELVIPTGQVELADVDALFVPPVPLPVGAALLGPGLGAGAAPAASPHTTPVASPGRIVSPPATAPSSASSPVPSPASSPIQPSGGQAITT